MPIVRPATRLIEAAVDAGAGYVEGARDLIAGDAGIADVGRAVAEIISAATRQAP